LKLLEPIIRRVKTVGGRWRSAHHILMRSAKTGGVGLKATALPQAEAESFLSPLRRLRDIMQIVS